MKRIVIFLPLLALAPLGYFLGSYCDGAGIIPRGSGFLASAVFMFLFPWLIAALFLKIQNVSKPIRLSLFICALLVQMVLLFAVPPAATSEMMGIAHLFRCEFSPNQLRGCADQLRYKFQNGTLTTNPQSKDIRFTIASTALVVADSEIPSSVRGKFQRVFIQTNSALGEVQVVFALDADRGIICDDRKNVREFFVCSMADGVHAYRYQRL